MELQRAFSKYIKHTAMVVEAVFAAFTARCASRESC